MQIKDVSINDIDSHKEILFLAMWKPENQIQYDFNIMEAPHVKAYYDKWNKKENDIGLFLMDGNKVAALAQLRKKRSPTIRFSDIPELVVAVKPEYQGQGIATQLINELIQRNPSRGIRLNVHPENKKAISLYHKLGFEIYYEDEEGFISMILIHKKDTFFI